MIHDFTKHSLCKLYKLRGDLLKSLKTEFNESVKEPIQDTLNQIDSELTKRGYSKIRETIKILP